MAATPGGVPAYAKGARSVGALVLRGNRCVLVRSLGALKNLPQPPAISINLPRPRAGPNTKSEVNRLRREISRCAHVSKS